MVQAGDADDRPVRFRKGSSPIEALAPGRAAEGDQRLFGTGVIVEPIGGKAQKEDGDQQRDGGEATAENAAFPGAFAHRDRLPSYAIVRQVPEF